MDKVLKVWIYYIDEDHKESNENKSYDQCNEMKNKGYNQSNKVIKKNGTETESTSL